MPRTTPPRPVDIAAVFPELRAHSRTTTRLHPRPGAPGRGDSSVGGPLLWPAAEPWPTCTESHDEAEAVSVASVRQYRRGLADEEEYFELGDEPVLMLGAAQLYARDIPDFAGPPGTDLLQVLWCPFDHEPTYLPAVVLRWRRAADVTEVLDPQPEPEDVQEFGSYLPEPCVLHPEQVLEYQYGDLLPGDLGQRIGEWEQQSGLSYQYDLSIADGWKAGGWASWSLTDPYPVTCDDCGRDMELLLTVASSEWDGEGSWRPIEEDRDGPSAHEPTRVSMGRGYRMYVFTCPASFEHPHQLVMQ